jgi:histidine triad (HIT) family protein
MVAAQKVARAIRQALKPDGLNVLQASGAAAFQSVPHFHLHLIPRWTNDGKGFDWKLVPGVRAQITGTGEKIRAVLEGEA